MRSVFLLALIAFYYSGYNRMRGDFGEEKSIHNYHCPNYCCNRQCYGLVLLLGRHAEKGSGPGETGFGQLYRRCSCKLILFLVHC